MRYKWLSKGFKCIFLFVCLFVVLVPTDIWIRIVWNTYNYLYISDVNAHPISHTHRYYNTHIIPKKRKKLNGKLGIENAFIVYKQKFERPQKVLDKNDRIILSQDRKKSTIEGDSKKFPHQILQLMNFVAVATAVNVVVIFWFFARGHI